MTVTIKNINKHPLTIQMNTIKDLITVEPGKTAEVDEKTAKNLAAFEKRSPGHWQVIEKIKEEKENE